MKELTAHVYISNTAIQVITAGESKNNRLHVEAYYEETFEEGSILNGIIMNNYALQNKIADMWKKHNLPVKDVHLVVNGSSITTKHMKIPQIAPKNIPGLIRTEFKDLDNIQNMLIDYSVVVPRNADGSCSIFAVLSPKEFITSYIDIFRDSKIELSVIDLQQNALIKLMKHFKSLQDKTFAVFILDKTMLIECLFSNNDFVMTRRSRIFALPGEDNFRREIGQHINSIIQFNKSEQTGSDITDIFLCGFPDKGAGLIEQYSQNFGINAAAFPEFTAAELTIPEGFDPSAAVELLGGMIRYSS